MSDSYVCSKAKIKCSCGDRISTLTVFPDRTIWLTGKPQANISDHISMRNIAPFGRCHTTRYPATGSATAANHGKLTPMPCVPNTPFPWMGGKDDVILKGHPALLKSSTCKCVWGGTISLTLDGQADGTGRDLDKEDTLSQEELDANAEVELSPEDLLDGLQMALDAAGMFPGLGAIPDLLNACISACRGNWADAGLSLFAAIPGIGDAAGAAKLLKNGAKIAKKAKKGKSISKFGGNGMESMSESIAKGPNRELAEARAKRMGVDQKDMNVGSYYDTAPKGLGQKDAFLDLTKRDQFEMEENKAIDYIKKSEKSGDFSDLKIDIQNTSNNPFKNTDIKSTDAVTPEEVLKNQALNKPKIDYKPIPEKPKEKPILGKNIDYNA